jgi:Fuc2NAc and GlcNAc transferase
MRNLGFTFLAFVIAGLGTGLLRRYALKKNVFDVPNERSSHTVPTPRGGGLAIVVAASLAFGGLAFVGALDVDLALALIGGGVAVAAVGFLDDRHRVSVRVRLAVHFAAAFWALTCLGGLPPIQMGDYLATLGWAGYVLGSLGIVWALNLFNFMDGIDGIATTEAVCIVWGGALLAAIVAGSTAVSGPSLVFGGACLGFLLWNWPPARIFMGDVGSGYMGYVIAVLALAAAEENPVSLLAWLILGGVFFVDATVTLVCRLLRRERVYEAHRSHAYQWLARRWNSHRRVTLLVLAVNVAWLLPMAWYCLLYPSNAVWIVGAAFAPLIVVALFAQAGRETSLRRRGT